MRKKREREREKRKGKRKRGGEGRVEQARNGSFNGESQKDEEVRDKDRRKFVEDWMALVWPWIGRAAVFAYLPSEALLTRG